MRPTHFPLVMLALGFAAPVAAQDFTGNVDPSAYTGPMVMQSAIDAQAKRKSATRRGPANETDTARTCAELPQFRATFGARDARVIRLTALCRQAGY